MPTESVQHHIDTLKDLLAKERTKNARLQAAMDTLLHERNEREFERDTLRAENARLQARVEEAERELAEHGCRKVEREAFRARDGYKALAERRKDGPTVVCLCGSTRFMDAFQEWGWKKTLDGEIVLSVGVSKYLPSDHAEREKYLGEEVEAALDELHKRKIDLADYIFVLNVGGYIGDSTRSEIEYAESLGMRVDYLEPRAAIEEEEI